MSEEAGVLEFLPREGEPFAERALSLARSAKRGLLLHPWTEGTRALAARIAREVPGASLRLHAAGGQIAGAPAPAAWDEVDAVVLDSAAGHMGEDLLGMVDFPRLQVLAPLSPDYYLARPLFLVSIPKSGTHLLNRLAEIMGYTPGIVHDEFPAPGHWYCVEYTNTHTVARDFFVDSVRRAPFGNRYHPFVGAPAVFIYRHPLDILVSEANYYHREGKTTFGGYLSSLSFEQRVHRLLDDPWLLGSIRDRVGAFAPWMEFENVIPVSFEEVVGPAGGGKREDQLRAIWSLQLKLQVPGRPDRIADQVFDRDSPTFHQGRIGAWRSSLSEEHLARIRALDQDFIRVFGYDLADAAGGLSRRAAGFLHRPLRVSPPLHEQVPIALEYHYLGFNLVRFDGWVYAVPQAAGPGCDLRKMTERRLRLLPRERNLAALKHHLLIKSLWWAGSAPLLAYYVAARLTRADAWGGGLRAASRTALRGLLRRHRR